MPEKKILHIKFCKTSLWGWKKEVKKFTHNYLLYVTKRLGKNTKEYLSEMEKSNNFQGKKWLEKFDLFLIKITKKEIEDQIKKWIGFWGKKGLEIRSKRDCPIRFWSFTIKIVTTMHTVVVSLQKQPQRIVTDVAAAASSLATRHHQS